MGCPRGWWRWWSRARLRKVAWRKRCRTHPRGNHPGQGAAKVFGTRIFYATWMSQSHFQVDDASGREYMLPLLALTKLFGVVIQLSVIMATGKWFLLIQAFIKCISMCLYLWRWFSLMRARRELFTYAANVWMKLCPGEVIPVDAIRQLWDGIFNKLFPKSLGKNPRYSQWAVERCFAEKGPGIYARVIILVNVVLSGTCLLVALSPKQPQIFHEPQLMVGTLVA